MRHRHRVRPETICGEAAFTSGRHRLAAMRSGSEVIYSASAAQSMTAEVVPQWCEC